ncbi:transmembrane protein 179 [Leguminivora glycinivorella]|uniref:transmembrane protein 179 n=1 Tax=Leguminivora glycinivorella TaxID=1035111 RepID=UPI00200E62D7|nr:transmembrane protein 179 [Leguminivora glycinivorella]
MALTNVVLVSQIAGYFVGLILSLCIMVPMSMHVHEFNGHCLLFSGGEWQETDGQFNVQWASMAYCNYVIAIGVLLFVVCLVQIYRLSMLLYRDNDSSFFSAFLEATGCALLCAMLVCAAITVTLGFMTWCRNITDRFPSCDVAAGQDIDKKDNIYTNNFYMEIGTVQFGAWGAFATCVGLAVFSTLKLCRYHQLENIRVSMFRERQRLVNESPPTSTPPVRARRPHPQTQPQDIEEER